MGNDVKHDFIIRVWFENANEFIYYVDINIFCIFFFAITSVLRLLLEDDHDAGDELLIAQTFQCVPGST